MRDWLYNAPNVGASGGDSPTGLVADAVASFTADASAVASLSPQSRIMVVTIENAIEGVIGKSIDSIARDLAANVSDALGAVVKDSITNVSEAIPFIGQVLSAVMVIVDDITGKEQAKEAQKEANAQSCARREAQFTPVGTDPGRVVVPADIFGRYDKQDAALINLEWDYVESGAVGPRPTIGESLIRVTEDFKERAALIEQLRKGGWKGSDIPSNRRKLFQKLREAIEIQRKHSPKGSTDGGKALFPLYLDLLRDTYSRGWMSDSLASFLLGMRIGVARNGKTLAVPEACYATSTVRAHAVRALITGWEQTIAPWYGPSKEKQDALEKQAAEIAAGIASKRSGKPIRIRLALARPKHRVIKQIAAVGVLYALVRLLLIGG